LFSEQNFAEEFKCMMNAYQEQGFSYGINKMFKESKEYVKDKDRYGISFILTNEQHFKKSRI